METTNILESLLLKGWNRHESAGFSEKVGQDASHYYSYDIPNGDKMTLCYFEKEGIVKIRIAGKSDKSWFSLKSGHGFKTFAEKLTEMQYSVSQDNYFSFYFGLQSFAEDFTILAWEQWEPNYR